MPMKTILALAMVLLPGLVGASTPESPDLAEARALFSRNLEAIAKRDRAAYLACYLNSDTLARTGPTGAELGFAGLEKSAGEAWPDTFEALDLRLVPVRPGVVYGTYRYRVRYGADEHAGLSERFFLKTPAGWKIAVSTAFDAPPGTPPPPRALVGATVVDGTGAPPILDAVVLVREGRIECVGTRKACPVPEGVTVVDLAGRWITPGVVDAHVHFSQTGWADGRPDALDLRDLHPYEKTEAELEAHPERWFRSYLCSGVTAVFDVGGYSWTTAMAARTDSNAAAPRVAAAGPLLSTFDHWLNLPADRQFIYLKDEATAREGVRFLASRGSAAVKVWYIVTPERSVEASAPAVLAAAEEARRLGLPLIVHATGLAEAKMALRAGARMLVHSVEDLPVDAEFLDLAKANGTIYCPTLTVFGGYRRMGEAVLSRKAPEIDDPNGCVDPATRALLAEVGERDLSSRLTPEAVERWRSRSRTAEEIGAANLRRVAEAGIPIAMGTDAGNPLTLHGPSVYAEMEAMQAAGLTPTQVLMASTRGGAQALGREKDIGTIAKGKWADLLVVDADPTVTVANLRRLRYVVRGGVVRSLEELRAVVAAPPAQP
jgi:imidazolonepropionase-like amidohydrolase